MSNLNLNANLENPDDFYASLLGAHSNLSKPESDALNARLVLVLANHIGVTSVLMDALKASKTSS